MKSEFENEEAIRRRVEGATAKIVGVRTGLGVRIGAYFILTAAHCIHSRGMDSMALEIPSIQGVESLDGRKFTAKVLAVEPVSDIAVLGPLDPISHYIEGAAFERFCEGAEPLRLCWRDHRRNEKFPVFVYTHQGKLIAGSADQTGDFRQLIAVEMDEQIGSGTSGGPIINTSGELVGIVSSSTSVETQGQRCRGGGAFPSRALSKWVYEEIREFEAVESESEL